MVKLATQLIDRQTGRYDPADLEDRYETRLRAMIEAKVKGLKLEDDEEPDEAPSNVIDLMAALRRSLGEDTGTEKAPAAGKKPPSRKPTAAKAEQARRQPALKLPIDGGKKKVEKPNAKVSPAATSAPATPARGRRKAS